MKISKKQLFYFGPVVLVLLVGVTALFLILQRQKASPVVPVAELVASPIPVRTGETKTWTDNENGINFSYPANFSVDKFFDKASVAGWILTTKEATGSLTVKIQEPANAYTLKEWLPTYKEATRAASIVGLTIAGEKGSQYIFATPSAKVTATFHQGFLYLFEGASDKGGIFDKAYDNLLSSFAFLPEPTSSGSAGGGGSEGNVEYEGEEVVE